tara:strand:+ start:3214 stop:3678 length:465 start_codon:yes stop_codon:yes gene_type:complete
MAMERGVINGGRMVLYLNSELTILSSSLSWSIDHKVRDTTCREGNAWNTSMGGNREWSMTLDNALAFRNSSGTLYSATAGQIGIDDIIYDNIINREKVNAQITIVGQPTGNYKWSGDAYITGVEMSTPMEDSSTFSLNIAGINALRLGYTGTQA